MFCKQALDIQVEDLGLNHPELYTAYAILAEIFRIQGRDVEADEMEERATMLFEPETT